MGCGFEGIWSETKVQIQNFDLMIEKIAKTLQCNCCATLSFALMISFLVLLMTYCVLLCVLSGILWCFDRLQLVFFITVSLSSWKVPVNKLLLLIGLSPTGICISHSANTLLILPRLTGKFTANMSNSSWQHSNRPCNSLFHKMLQKRMHDYRLIKI